LIKRRELISLVASGIVLLALLALCFWLTSLDFGGFRPATPTAAYVLWALTTCLVLGAIALGFLLSRNIVKLYVEYRKGKLGSRVISKLVAGVLVLSLAPIAMHVYFSITLLNRNFDKWFSQANVEILQSAGRLMERASEELLVGLRNEANSLASSPIANTVLRTGEPSQGLRDFLGELSADFLILAPASGQLAPVEVSIDEETVPDAMRLAVDSSSITPQSGVVGNLLFATTRIETADGLAGTLALGRRIPASILTEQEFMLAQVREWQQLEANRPLLWRGYASILALVTIFVLFLAVWLAQFASKQITRPIEALVTATGELAGGHLDYRVDPQAMDELASLVQSFNSMSQALEAKTSQLERSNQDLAAANAELQDRRRLINAILESISPGVISVGEHREILKFNESARGFSADPSMSSLEAVTAILDGKDQEAFEHMFSSARRRGIVSRDFEVDRSGRAQHLSITVSSLDSDHGQHGFVVVLEDTTELVHAKQSEAWQEVARRLAHEIKNPLTPVALAAGRIDRQLDRYSDRNGGTDWEQMRNRLKQATSTIQREVQSLKALVDRFSDLARFPAIHPENADLNAVVRDAVGVFDGRLPGIELSCETAPGIAAAHIDPESIKRVIINLIDNAAEVLQDSWAKQIGVSTRTRPDEGTVELTVADSGPGISASNKEMLFVPYFSTKGRGTGLGLAIVRSVISDHRGTIRVEDNEPSGTRFVIELPAARYGVAELQEVMA